MPLLWLFEAPRNTTCYVDKRVLSGERAILVFVCESGEEPDTYVYHAMTGEEGTEVNYISIVCLEDVVATDPTISELASLPVDWWATRASPESEWHIEPIPESEKRET